MALKKCGCGKAYAADRLKKCPFCKRPNPDYPGWVNKTKKEYKDVIDQTKREVEKQEKERKEKENATSPCKSCGHMVSDMAMTCPSCGQQCPSQNFYSPGAEAVKGFGKFIFYTVSGIFGLMLFFYALDQFRSWGSSDVEVVAPAPYQVIDSNTSWTTVGGKGCDKLILRVEFPLYPGKDAASEAVTDILLEHRDRCWVIVFGTMEGIDSDGMAWVVGDSRESIYFHKFQGKVYQIYIDRTLGTG